MEKGNYRRIIFLILFFGLFILVARLFYPFLTIIVWSGLFYALLTPLFDRLARRRDGGERGATARTILAGGFALGGVLILVVPIFLLAWSIIRQAADLAGTVVDIIETTPHLFDLSPAGPIGGLIANLTKGTVDLSGFDLKGELSSFLAGSADRILGFSGAILRNLLNLVLTLAFMIFTLFFLFVDGSHLARVIVNAVPIEREYTSLFLKKLKETSRQLLEGFFLVALYQSVVAFALFSIFGVKAPLVLAALTCVASFVPMVGASLIWLPVSLTVILGGNLAGGIALLILSALLISTADNFIRPFILQKKLQIHPLLIFFAIVGGLQIFGLNGLILGPLILILFFTAAALFDRESDEQNERAEKTEGTEHPRGLELLLKRRRGDRKTPEPPADPPKS